MVKPSKSFYRGNSRDGKNPRGGGKPEEEPEGGEACAHDYVKARAKTPDGWITEYTCKNSSCRHTYRTR